jgi:hypothetical protein
MAGEAECAIGAPSRPVKSFLGAVSPRFDMIHYRPVMGVDFRPLAAKSAQFQVRR